MLGINNTARDFPGTGAANAMVRCRIEGKVRQFQRVIAIGHAPCATIATWADLKCRQPDPALEILKVN